MQGEKVKSLKKVDTNKSDNFKTGSVYLGLCGMYGKRWLAIRWYAGLKYFCDTEGKISFWPTQISELYEIENN